MTHSYVVHALLIFGTCLVHMWDMTCPYVDSMVRLPVALSHIHFSPHSIILLQMTYPYVDLIVRLPVALSHIHFSPHSINLLQPPGGFHWSPSVPVRMCGVMYSYV